MSGDNQCGRCGEDHDCDGQAAKTCATCRFMGSSRGIEAWDDDADSPFGKGDTRETGHHTCTRVIHGNSGGRPFAAISAEPAVVTDGSGYAARLCVLPTFGCVLHEAKEGTKP
jgi:hypothetical protein